ncbi:MAG TPA: DUF3883 domain-containing protein [Fimbriimonadaceae bacterium]|nr:DUF3883 domain-containing protein [Fimbriimonadaceae bacterium]
MSSLRVNHIELESIVVGYAMSRLDRAYLLSRRQGTWQAAYEEASTALGLPASSFKNLRDEFDPFFSNPRKGWWQREIREDRQRVLLEFGSVSDEALVEFVSRVLARDEEATSPIVEVLAESPARVANVAERLLTGRLAEEYFLENYKIVLGVSEGEINDMRTSARGFDFTFSHQPEVAIEVKGLRRASGNLLFTDREWREATLRGDKYWLAIIGDLESIPRHDLVKNPVAELPAVCTYQTTIVASWNSPYRLRAR